jgi:RNA polymerase-binding transcription factor
MTGKRKKNLRELLRAARTKFAGQLASARRAIATERSDGLAANDAENLNNGAHLELNVSVAASQAQVFSSQLAAVDRALERLEDGSYGHCDGCDREISEARLKAVPFAERCVECQEKAEESERQFTAKSRPLFIPLADPSIGQH